MNITSELLRIVEQAHSLVSILDAAARLIAERLCVDRCLVFLVDERGDLIRSAVHDATGSPRDSPTTSGWKSSGAGR